MILSGPLKMDNLEKLNELIVDALNAESLYQAASDEEKQYSNITSDRKSDAHTAWNAIHNALGELKMTNDWHGTAFKASKLGKLLAHWSASQYEVE